jgi:hypothetical protein
MLVVAFSGCAARAPLVVNQAVGPARSQASRREGEGVLVVYSALEVANAVDSSHPTHAGYAIFNPVGKILRRVDNRAGSFYQDPMPVGLPAGTYKVEARATNQGLVIVPVVIEGGRTTILDLDASILPQSEPQSDDQWVRLPDGQVIGVKAD